MQVLAIAVIMAATGIAAGLPDGAADWGPDAVSWQRTNPDGTRFALLEGVRDRAAPFSYAFFIPAGVWDAPHSHAATARVFVACGTLRLGYGNRTDKASARSFPARSYLIVPAGTVHFDGADTDTVLIGTAVGPWSTDYIDPPSLPSASAPRVRTHLGLRDW